MRNAFLWFVHSTLCTSSKYRFTCRRRFMSFRRYLKMLLKKHFIFIVIILVVLIYILSTTSFFQRQTIVIKTKRLDDCISSLTEPYATKINNFDAISSSLPVDVSQTKYTLPYSANGYIGTALAGSNRLYIGNSSNYFQILNIEVPYSPVLSFNIPGYTALEKVLLDIVDGTVMRLSCYKQRSMCVSAKFSVYSHRVVPHLIVQQLSVSNPTSNQLNIQLFKERSSSNWPNSISKSVNLLVEGNKYEYKQLTGVVSIDGMYYLVSILEPNFPPFITVKPSDVVDNTFLTFVRYSIVTSKSVPNSTYLHQFARSVFEHAAVVMRHVKVTELHKVHTAAWSNLWQQGFSITTSLAPNALNGDRINATLYYMLTQRPYYPISGSNAHTWLQSMSKFMNVSFLGVDNLATSNAASNLHRYENCFGGHDLFQASNLWLQIDNEVSLHQLAHVWLITLSKFRCTALLSAGAHGFLQAALLGIGEFSYSGSHLEFNMHPSLLVRDMTFRSIAYGPQATVNITVEVDDSNKALLFVSVVSLPNKEFYACDAGCQDSPVALSNGVRTQLPLKITKPRTALLYITANKNHIQELKLVIHVREIVEAPAHEHHVIALHKHGHPYGGLPLLFWIILISLIVVFHLFLCKLIYTELCKGEPVIPAYTKYGP